MVTFSYGILVTMDSQFYVDPSNPMMRVKYIKSRYPSGVMELLRWKYGTDRAAFR